jgi:predicted regulator of Ras-like GTPase activity (Roadblock/LC7/MglB family)
MQPSTFSKILEEGVTSIPGALGAIFVDWEGETIDRFSHMGDTHLRIVGAQWGITYYQTQSTLSKHALGSPSLITLRFAHQQILIKRITDEYLVIMALEREANLGRAIAFLQKAEARIREEIL